ncbi:MAG: Flp pilus assembly complex ATPase component TadA [Candidatus Omnitrophica bacterium]|nr:Flp pilus assembly complex ATPase component TadA [Candidatus Omnitrophota bacterium]
MARKKFTDYIIEKNLLSKEELDKALSIQKVKGLSLVELLVKLGYVSEQQIVTVLSGFLSIPPIRILNLNIPVEVINYIPEKVAQKYKVLPIGKMGSTITIAMADPLDVLIIDDLRKITKCEVNPVIALLSEIEKAISSYYTRGAKESLEDIVKGSAPESLEVIKSEEAEISEAEIVRFLEDAPIVKFTGYIFKKGVGELASDILIEPLESISRVRFRIDGILKEAENFPKKMHPFVVSRIKVMCNLNISEHRLPQEGRFRSKILNRDIDFRVSILPSSLGEKVVLRVLDKTTALLDVDLLGIQEKVLKQVKEDSFRPHGLILVCGPTGSGKTTTLYSIINHIYTPRKNIITVEDPIEYQLKGINQVSINPAINLTFAACLRSVLRQDPDIVMIGEIRDSETADIAIKSALTGHLVLSTLHTTTSAGSITRLINMGIEPFLLSSTLIGVLTQRLVRQLCPKCREEFDVSKGIREKYFIDKAMSVYRAKGCGSCQTGYKGRTVLGEYLRSSATLKTMINTSVSEQGLKKESRIEGMQTLREDGLAKISEGITSLEEVLKTTGSDEPVLDNEG